VSKKEKNITHDLTFTLTKEQLASLQPVISSPELIKDVSSVIEGNSLRVSFIQCNRAFAATHGKNQA
jgi:hypothetical protein